MTAQQAKAMREVARAILSAIIAGGTLGAPGGVLYAALMTAGCTFDQFNSIMRALNSTRMVEQHGDCWHITPAGRAFNSLPN